MAEAEELSGGRGPDVGRHDILNGPILSALLRLAWPTAATSMLQGLVAAADTVMVGRLGETAVAAVTSCRQALMVVLVSGSAIAAGCGVLVAQAIGRGDRDEANHVVTQSLLLFLVLVTFGLMPLGWYTAPWLLEHLTRDPQVIALGVPYLRCVICSLLFTLTGFASIGALRGAGDVKTGLRLTIGANAINVVANYCFIFGVPALGIPRYGVLGAAIGTVIARGLSNVVLWAWMFRGRLVLRLEPLRRWRFDWPVYGRILRIGLPTSVSAVALNLYGLLVIGILARTDAGRLAVAAYGLGSVLRNFGTWMTWGLSEATLAMVGQNVGAEQPERAYRVGATAAKVSALFMFLMGLSIAALGPVLLPLILRDPDAQRRAEVIRIAVVYLATQLVALPFLGVGMSLRGACRGAGDTVAPMAIDLITLLAVAMPCCAFLALEQLQLGPISLPGAGLGPLGVWLGMVFGPICNGVLSTLYWRSGRWRRYRA